MQRSSVDFPEPLGPSTGNGGAALNLEADIVYNAMLPEALHKATNIQRQRWVCLIVTHRVVLPLLARVLNPGFDDCAEQPIQQDRHGERFEHHEVGRLDVVGHIG